LEIGTGCKILAWRRRRDNEIKPPFMLRDEYAIKHLEKDTGCKIFVLLTMIKTATGEV
jgi:hypothetical protein